MASGVKFRSTGSSGVKFKSTGGYKAPSARVRRKAGSLVNNVKAFKTPKLYNREAGNPRQDMQFKSYTDQTGRKIHEYMDGTKVVLKRRAKTKIGKVKAGRKQPMPFSSNG